MTGKRVQTDVAHLRQQIIFGQVQRMKRPEAAEKLVLVLNELVALWSAAANLLTYRGYMFVPQAEVELFERALRGALGRSLPQEVLDLLEGYRAQ